MAGSDSKGVARLHAAFVQRVHRLLPRGCVGRRWGGVRSRGGTGACCSMGAGGEAHAAVSGEVELKPARHRVADGALVMRTIPRRCVVGDKRQLLLSWPEMNAATAAAAACRSSKVE